MPGRKKGRQRGSARSKAHCARKWDDALREAKQDLSFDRRTKYVRGGDSAPPRLSVGGFRSLNTLLRQRARADRVAEEAPAQIKAPEIVKRTPRSADASYFSMEWPDNRPHRARTLLSLCMSQIGRDFLAYNAGDEALAEAFSLLPTPCLSRLSRAASATGSVADHNIGLLCNPGVTSLYLRGRFTNEGASALLPVLLTPDARSGRLSSPQGDAQCCEAYRDTATERPDGVYTNDAEMVDEKSEHASTRHEVETLREKSFPEPDVQDDDWETADDRLEACLKGGVSLLSLDLSSPLITADFVKRLVVKIPSLQRLGLKGCLHGDKGGPDAVCDHVPRLTALRELDVSHCPWFCDITLRRFATVLAAQGSPPQKEELGPDQSDPIRTFGLDTVDEEAGNWGAASTPAAALGVAEPSPPDPTAHSWFLLPRTVQTDAADATAAGGGGQGGSFAVAITPRLRIFTLRCIDTAVTEKQAMVAETLSPGLTVVHSNR